MLFCLDILHVLQGMEKVKLDMERYSPSCRKLNIQA